MILQTISFLCACAGTIFYFCNLPLLAVLCGVITLAESITNVLRGTQNNLITEIATLIIGLILALIFRLHIPSTLAVALCISNLLFTVIGWCMALYQTKHTPSPMKVFEYLKSSPETPTCSPELLEKEKQLAQVEKSLEILRKRQTDVEEGLKFAAENDVSELVQAGIYSQEKANEALNAIETMQHIAKSTPNMIRVTEEMRDRLIDEIEALKKT